MRILTEPDASLTEQYTALLATEGLTLQFTVDGISRIAEIAWEINERNENIGARRLHTVMERLLEEASFEANIWRDKIITIDNAYVDKQLSALVQNHDLSQFIL